MNDLENIISAKPWPSAAALARDLKCPAQTVVSWGGRGIPSKRWLEIQRAAADRGWPLSMETIAAMPLADLVQRSQRGVGVDRTGAAA